MSDSSKTGLLHSSTSISTSTGVRQHVSQNLLDGLELLSLPVTVLSEYLASIAEENPMLDLSYCDSFLQFEEIPSEIPQEQSYQDDEPTFFNDCDFTFATPFSEYHAFDLHRLHDDYSETETLKSHLRMQMTEFRYSTLEQKVIHEIIENIDDDGFFVGSLHVMASHFKVDIDTCTSLLLDVQNCDPCGVAARNLGECLLLQAKKSDTYSDVYDALLTQDLMDLAFYKTARLQKKYRLSQKEIAAIRAEITRLNPRPGSAFFQQNKTTYIVPDIYIGGSSSGFSVEVTGERAASLTINKNYFDLLSNKTLDNTTYKWLTSKKNEAQTVLNNLSQRKQTLLRLGRYLVEAQYSFLQYGEARLNPLVMQQAADALDIHVSTVSRAVSNKYALTPWGVYPLKNFFSKAITCSSPNQRATLSSFVVKKRIKELVASERQAKPLSDEAIKDILNNEGIEIKRRTVAKYRDALGISRQSLRRR